MKKVNELPVLSGEAQRPKTEVSLNDLKGYGNQLGGYTARVGDVINFPDTKDDVQAFIQPVRPGSTAVQRVIVVNRNGKPDYFSLGVLTRRDIHGEPAKNGFAKEMAQYDSDASRVEALCGKTIKCTAVEKIETYVFDNGVINREKTQQTNVPVFEYVQ